MLATLLVVLAVALDPRVELVTLQQEHRDVEAAKALFKTRDYEDVTLQAVAAGAGITLQTVLRRFGSKEGLVIAVADVWGAEIQRSRVMGTPGDLGEAARVLIEVEFHRALSFRIHQIQLAGPGRAPVLLRPDLDKQQFMPEVRKILQGLLTALVIQKI